MFLHDKCILIATSKSRRNFKISTHMLGGGECKSLSPVLSSSPLPPPHPRALASSTLLQTPAFGPPSSLRACTLGAVCLPEDHSRKRPAPRWGSGLFRLGIAESWLPRVYYRQRRSQGSVWALPEKGQSGT